MEHAIVGFEFTGDPLLEGAFLPLEAGLTVVYGLNGSGKTRLLSGITAALTGVRSGIGIGLIVRAAHPTAEDVAEDGLSRNSRCSGAGLLLALAQSQTGSNTRTVTGHAHHYAEDLLSLTGASEMVNNIIRSEIDYLPDTPEELAQELLGDRLFFLYPTGTAEIPSWEAWPVADPAKPAAKAELTRLERAKEAFHLDEDFDAWDLVMENSLILTPSEAGLTTRTRDEISVESFAPYSGDKVGVVFPGIMIQGPIDFGLDLLPVPEDVSAATIAYLGEVVDLTAAASVHKPEELITTFPDAINSLFAHGFPLASAREWGSRHVHFQGSKSGATDALAMVVEQVAKTAGDELSELGTAHFEGALFDAPRILLQVVPSALRFTHPPARWLFRRAVGSSTVGIDELSRAERRWAEYAISEALYWHRRTVMSPQSNALRPALVIIDEPEAALHRSAEAQIAQSLVTQSRDPRRMVMAATHSPELLNLPEAHLIEVKRNAGVRGRSVVRPLDLSDRAALERLGLTPSDLLRWPRVFLLVEGLHDELILDEYFGARLRSARIQILPLRGATKLPNTIDSRVLFDFTDAHVVALVDNQRGDLLSRVWAEAQSVRLLGTIEQANLVVVEGISGKDEESRFMREWLTAALAKGLESRVTPYGLVEKDVIEYVPVSALVAGAQDWTTLRGEHASDRIRDKNVPHDFKRWLELTRRVEVTPDTLRKAVRADTLVPKELERLMKFLEAKAARE